ncbi:MAG: hypothetical protein Q9220_004318 [cf. Caloplaca sp. 1 TL-2023]
MSSPIAEAPKPTPNHASPFPNINRHSVSNIYTTSLTNETDITTHDSLITCGKIGLINRNGIVCSILDFGPKDDADEREVRTRGKGDVMVQRGTMHAWRNASKTEWARMVSVGLAAGKVEMGGKVLGDAVGEMPERV